MVLAKLKAVFTGKSTANRNPGAVAPAPSTTGEHGTQPQNVPRAAAPVPSLSAPGAPGQVDPAREGGDVGPGPAHRRFPKLRVVMSRLRLFLRRGKRTKAKQAETEVGNKPGDERRSHSSLSIRTVPRGNTPPAIEEEDGESTRVLDGHSVYEERVINPGFSVMRPKRRHGQRVN